ncbi:hypothetical protein [Moraxella nasicaprae]|uniref:Lipoprotein n=1 Tax=Moraxella nasicaprae TaxID=2904122 RepID=A0ABY6F4F9_9GAMM|nr:hypothetical protein [Moraxella nasicaprae]UXZ04924.1 hypothetical protein LU297_00235 [Moraxella nasicaprae]
MQRLLLTLPMFALLSACVAPVDSTGKAVPVVINPAPAVIIDNRTVNKADPTAPIHQCKLKAFTTTFTSENVSRGKAKLDVQKQCQGKFNAMFCEEKDIECTEYK